MSEESQPSGSDRRSPVALRVLPQLVDSAEPTRTQDETLAAAWARGADQADWCVDASVTLAAGCVSADSGVTTMPASERRAIHLARQGVRARAILAAAEPGPAHERRERTRRWAIVIGSAVLHAVGFVVLATAVADLQPRPRPATHEHLFEARAVVPIEPAPVSVAPVEEQAQPDEPPIAAPQPRSPSRQRKPSAPADAQSSASSRAARMVSTGAVRVVVMRMLATSKRRASRPRARPTSQPARAELCSSPSIRPRSSARASKARCSSRSGSTSMGT
jgi:hypothetical protein